MSQLVRLEGKHTTQTAHCAEFANLQLNWVLQLSWALSASMTLSFSSLVLSPLSFSICEEVKLSRPRASTLSLAHSAIIQMIKLQWLKLRVLSFPSFIVLPRMSAVSLRSTKICTFMFASLSDSSGRIQAMHLSTFLMRTSETQIITSNHNTYQMSTLLWRRRLCWKMLGRSQVEDKTLTSSLSMPKLSLILSRLSVLSVAELSMNGTPWYVALSQRHRAGE